MKTRVIALVVGVSLIGLIVLAAVNHVAIKAWGHKAVEKSEEIAERQTIENWEVLFRDAMNNLGREIAAQDRQLQELRVQLARDRVQLERARGLLEKYDKLLAEFADKVKAADGGIVVAHGREYSAESAQAQLKEFARAVVDQKDKVAALESRVGAEAEAVAEVENALRIARQQMQTLEAHGQEMIRQKQLAELTWVSVEMNNALAGLDPQAPLSGAMKRVNGLLMKMQGYTDEQRAHTEIAIETIAGEDHVLSANQALNLLNYSEREEKIDAEVDQAINGTD